jgi:hypothetical protein
MTDVQSRANTRRGLAMRSVSVVVALAVMGTSTSTVYAQAKATPKPAAPAKDAKDAAKAPAKAPAAKPGDKKAAGAAFKKGKEAFDKKDFKAAKESFLTADEILPAAAAQYYIARSSEELGETQDAAKYYEKALADGKLKEDLATDAKTRLDAIKKKPAKVKVTSDPPGATILVDGKAIPEKTPAEIDLEPGTHKITLQSAGKKDAENSVEVAAFTGATVSATLENAPPPPAEDPFAKKPPPPESTPAPTPEPAPAPAPVDTKKDMTWVYVTGGAAIVALGVGTFFGVQALGNKSKFDDAITANNASLARDERDKGTRNALISDMGFGIGITLAVTSAVLYFTRPEPEKAAAAIKPTTKLSVAPVVAPTMGGLSATVNF